MKWSNMSVDTGLANTREIGGLTYRYACETNLYENDDYRWDDERLGFIERWKTNGKWSGGGSVYNAWVCYGGDDCEASWVDLGWFDFDPNVLDEKIIICYWDLEELKTFVEQQLELLNKTV
jgi:hypothetical protein